MEDEYVYLMQVTCNNSDCYQFVAKEFFESHPNWKGFKMKIEERR